MAAMSKRAWKLEEFVAHAGAVNCLCLGHKSGRVLVTGGEDKKVNTWAVGKPNCIMSLAGHANPVEAVRFGHAEEMVIAGSMSGVLKIWDLEAAKIVRTLSGHKANIRCLDFHPYGDFVASGSQDTNLKIWDIRRKGCLFTYKGHTDGVSCLRFSPDGRWIVSGSLDSSIKLWDLTAGKQVSEFTQHRGAVSSIEFHPNEFLLASGSHDRTVKFWDLETFQMVSSTDEETSAVRTICFHPEGSSLYSGGENSLRVYTWEPARCIDALSVGWGKIVSISVAESSKQSQLIGASFCQTNVSTFVVDLQRIDSCRDVPFAPVNCPTPRKSFLMERPPTQCTSSKPVNIPKAEPCQDAQDIDEDLDQNIAHIKNEDAYEHIFQPKHTLSHSPPNRQEPFSQPNDVDQRYAAMNIQEKREKWTPVKDLQQVNDNRTAKPAHQPKIAMAPPVQPSQAVDPILVVKPPQLAPQLAYQPPIVHQIQQQPLVVAPRPTSNQSTPEREVGMNPDEFLPPPVVERVKSEEEIEQSVIRSVLRGHDSMVTVLSNRSRNLDIVLALWSSGSIRTAFDSAVSMNDQAVIVDILNIMHQKAALWNLELCAVVLVQANKLITSKYENYVMCACSCVRLVLRNFTAVIKTNVFSPPTGVDLVREERYDKCSKCYQLLQEIKHSLMGKPSNSGKLGPTFRELLLMLNLLD